MCNLRICNKQFEWEHIQASSHGLVQRFSTCSLGYAKKGDTSLIGGYAEGYNFDLGVPKYQKFENPWSSGYGRRH
jgi:hypothetical protein